MRAFSAGVAALATLSGAAALFLPSGGSAIGAGPGELLSLRAVEKAFSQAKLPFAVDWQPNSYLSKQRSPVGGLDPRFRPHLIGWADWVNPRTYSMRSVYVFDQAAVAASFVAWNEHHCTCSAQFTTIRAQNVAYFGWRSPAVATVMKSLAH